MNDMHGSTGPSGASLQGSPLQGPIDVRAPGGDPALKDSVQLVPGFGRGGVPWYLLLFYLSFLVFFTWYVLTYQLPDFLEQGPGQVDEAPLTPMGEG